MSTLNRLKYQIGIQTNTEKLIYLRDYGLDMILNDPDIDDFTESDKLEVIEIIEARLLEIA